MIDVPMLVLILALSVSEIVLQWSSIQVVVFCYLKLLHKKRRP